MTSHWLTSFCQATATSQNTSIELVGANHRSGSEVSENPLIPLFSGFDFLSSKTLSTKKKRAKYQIYISVKSGAGLFEKKKKWDFYLA